MRVQLLSVVIAAVMAFGSGKAFAQGSEPILAATTNTAVETIPTLRMPPAFSAAAQRTFPARNPHHASRQKRVIIGAVVGAGAGLLLALAYGGACDVPGCGGKEIALIGAFSGLGAAIGAFAEHNQIPAMPSRDHHVRISGTITQRRQQASATFAF